MANHNQRYTLKENYPPIRILIPPLPPLPRFISLNSSIFFTTISSYSFCVATLPFVAYLITAFSLGFKTTLEHRMIVLPSLTSRINPGSPQ